MSKLLRYCSAILVLLCLAIPVSMMAQGAGFGSISGVVQDPTGAVIPGAKVVVANQAKGIHREIETGSAGTFNVPALVPASGYTVTVTKSGFAGYEAKNVTVSVGEAVTLTANMNVAAGAAVVEVTGAAPMVDQTKVNVSSVVTSTQINELPINGRRVDAFVLITPGVSNDGTFGLLSFRGNPGGNNFLTDGNDTTNSFYDENAGRTRTYNISQDAVQEFQVVSANYSAEFGKASGGVVNTVTRSGSNAIHGSAYEFFRNKQLNARDVTGGGLNPQDSRHQAGVSVGGPIIKDKLFYFFNGEITRRENPAISTNLGNNLLNTDGSWKATCGAPATADQCTAAKGYILDRAKLQLVPRKTDVNLLFGKIDYHVNDKHSLSFSSNYLDFRSPNGIQTQFSLTGGSAIGNNADTNVFDRTGRASWTWLVSNHAVNEFRFGYFKDRQYDPASVSLQPSIGPFGLTVNGVNNLGYATAYPRLNPSEQRFQFADSYSWTIRNHNVKFGADFDRVEDYVDNLSNRFGSFTYTNLTTFAQDFSGTTTGKNWATYSQAFGNPIVDVKMPEMSAFVQDEWRVTPKLTINAGVRYDNSWIPQPTITNPDYPLTGKIPNNGFKFTPRFGFNYAVFDKTTIHGGFGIFNNRYTTSAIENLFVSNGKYTQSNSLSATTPGQLDLGPVFGKSLTAVPSAGAPKAGSVSILYADPNYRNPYSEQANFGIEREMAKNTTLSLSYVWSRTLHLQGSVDKNLPTLPTGCTDKVGGGFNAASTAATCYTYPILNASGVATGTYYTTPFYNSTNGAPTGKINTNYARTSALQSNNNSYYNALLVNVSHKYGKWVTGDVAYTWSHTIDYGIGGVGTPVLFGSFNPSTMNNGDFEAEKGSAATDRRHNLVMNGVFTPQFTESKSWAAKYLVNNWQLAVVSVVASSQPVTPTVSIGDKPSTALNFSLNGFGGSSRVPFLPIGSLDIGNLYRTDARISKVLPFGERYKVALSFEAFNVFNHVIVTGRNTQAYTTKACTAANTGCTVGAIAIVPTPTVYNLITATQSTPDGTTARRAQAAVRITF